jgi:hypothetical protein
VPVQDHHLDHSRRQDLNLINRLEDADREGFFRVLQEEQDARRICGFPPAYTVLSALEPERGKLLAYDQYVHPLGFESVSFASVAFYSSKSR